jgi:hypothetical protein
MDCADARYAPPLQLLRCKTDTSTDDDCDPAKPSTSPSQAVLRLTALDIDAGTHAKLFDYARGGWTEGLAMGNGDERNKNVNSVAMLHVAGDGGAVRSYLIASVDHRVCNMSPEAWGAAPGKTEGAPGDEDWDANCVEGLRATSGASNEPEDTDVGYASNAAAIVGTTYYYSDALKKYIRTVKRLDRLVDGNPATAPDFSGVPEVRIHQTLLTGNVADFTRVEENGVDDWIIDGDPNGVYLVGLRGKKIGEIYVFVGKVNPATEEVDRYAVLKIPKHAEAPASGYQVRDANGDPFPATPRLNMEGFGGAYTYQQIDDDGNKLKPRLFFSNNEGKGVFELDLPLHALESSTGVQKPWNTALNDGEHSWTTIHKDARLHWRAPSEATSLNDGTTCSPHYDAATVTWAGDPTKAPTASFAPTGPPTPDCDEDACGVCGGDGSSCDGAISCADATYASPLQLLRCVADQSTDAACVPAHPATTPVADSVLRLVALDVGEGRHAKIFDYDTAGWFNEGDALGSSTGDDTRRNANSVAMLHVASRVRIDRRFGTSRPHFEMLSLGHIDADSADFWTDRWLFSSSRSATEVLVFECAHVEVEWKIRRARGPSPPL